MNFITNHKFLEAESNFPKLSMITKNVFINHPRGYFILYLYKYYNNHM